MSLLCLSTLDDFILNVKVKNKTESSEELTIRGTDLAYLN